MSRVILLLSVALPFLIACNPTQPAVLEAELLFELQIGRLEHELGLFSREGVLPRRGNFLTLRDGIVFISNGSSNKMMGFTSYGDLLQLVYSPAENPRPVTLGEPSSTTDGRRITRRGVAFPFNQLERIAVDSRRILYAEDRVSEERQVWDEDLQTTLNRQILRFDANGAPLDYLGQEGVGGTPFPFITGLQITLRDELVVTGITRNTHKVWVFSPAGELLSTVRIGMDRLPVPALDAGYITVLDNVVAGVDHYRVYLKFSYYRTVVEQTGGREQGISFDHSRVYWIDLTTGRYEGYIELPRQGETQAGEHFELLGATRGEYLLLLARIDEDRSQLVMVDTNGRVLRRRVLQIPERNLLVRSFHVTADGILSALLAYPDRAEVVWWRSDRLLPGQS